MNIKEITDKEQWREFFNELGSPSFLQSWEWGQLQEKMGYMTLRLGIYKKEELIGIAQVIKIKAKRGNMLFIPHGPLITGQLDILPVLLLYLREIAKKEKYSFIRIAPIFEDNNNLRQMFKNLNFRIAPIYMHAERLWMLDITKDEETLIKEMRKTTRYSIRKAEKEGVVIEKQTGEKAVDSFWEIYEETADREGFIPFSKTFIKNEFDVFNETGNSLFLFGKVNNKIEASALIVFTKSTAFYHQGATTHSKIPVSYLLQWEAIKEAKKRGCRLYNFWGTLQPGRTPKNWGGLSLFKQGFGGYQVDYVPTQDYIISPKYYLSFLFEHYLKWRRGI